MLSIRRFIPLLALLVVGCQAGSVQSIDRPAPNALVWSQEVAQGNPYWAKAAQARWPGQHVVLFACHGGYDADGDWVVCPDEPRKRVPVAVVAQALKDFYPDSVIVLICCNDHGNKLGVPGVWYAKTLVWVFSDQYFSDTQNRKPNRPCPGAATFDDFVIE